MPRTISIRIASDFRFWLWPARGKRRPPESKSSLLILTLYTPTPPYQLLLPAIPDTHGDSPIRPEVLNPQRPGFSAGLYVPGPGFPYATLAHRRWREKELIDRFQAWRAEEIEAGKQADEGPEAKARGGVTFLPLGLGEAPKNILTGEEKGGNVDIVTT